MTDDSQDRAANANGKGIRRIIHRVVLVCSCAILSLFTAGTLAGWMVDGLELQSYWRDHDVALKVNPKPSIGTPSYAGQPPLPLHLTIQRGVLTTKVLWHGSPTSASWHSAGHRSISYELQTMPPDVHGVTLSVRLLYPWLLSAIYPGIFCIRRVRARRRLRRSDIHCSACNYNLSGNVSGICPECGLAIPKATMARIGIEEPAT